MTVGISILIKNIESLIYAVLLTTSVYKQSLNNHEKLNIKFTVFMNISNENVLTWILPMDKFSPFYNRQTLRQNDIQ